MCIRRLVSIILVSLFFILARPTWAQATPFADVRRQTEAITRFDSVDELSRVFLNSISSDAGILEGRHAESPMPQRYLDSVSLAAVSLGRIVSSKKLDEQSRLVIRNIAEDFAIKRTYALSNPKKPYGLTVQLRAPRTFTSQDSFQVVKFGMPEKWVDFAGKEELQFEAVPGLVEFHPVGRTDESVRIAFDGRDGEEDQPFTIDLEPAFGKDAAAYQNRAADLLIRNAVDSVRLVSDIEPHEWLILLRGYLKEFRSLNTKKTVPDDYKSLLTNYQLRFNDIAKDGAVDDMEREELRELMLEIEKLARAANKQGDWPARITVVVLTKDNAGQPVDNLEVWFGAPGYITDKSKHKRFERWSTPTWRDLIPVRWLLWTQNPEDSRRRGPVTPLDLSDVRKKAEIVDLQAPR